MMHDLSDNKYIKSRQSSSGVYNLNRLLFGESAARKAVRREDYTLAIHDLLDSVGFALYLSGYKYLADLTERYLLSDDYTFENAIKDLSSSYRIAENIITDNVWASVHENRTFEAAASKLLQLDSSSFSIDSISDVVEILGAIFTRYFNYYLK